MWLCPPSYSLLLGSHENRRWRNGMRRKSSGSAWGQDSQINPGPLHCVLFSKAEGLLDLFSLMLPMSPEWLDQLGESSLDSSRAMSLMLFKVALVHIFLRQTIISANGASATYCSVSYNFFSLWGWEFEPSSLTRCIGRCSCAAWLYLKDHCLKKSLKYSGFQLGAQIQQQ